MGCCPSKSRAERDACASKNQERVAASASVQDTAAERSTNQSVEGVAPLSPDSTNNQHGGATPATLLMDRGDGALMFKSDSDPTPSSPPPTSASEIVFSSGVSGLNGKAGERDAGKNRAGETRSVEPATTTSAHPSGIPSPTRMPQCSPRKAPMNYEDMPIDSMYHRIHTVEAEALDSRRQEELREEAARREREVREFKAAMQVT